MALESRGLLRGGLWIKRTQSVYSAAQVSQWLSKIEYPGSFLEASLESLNLLVQLAVTTFPFENTPMHYTPAHSMDISYEGLYKRMIETSGNKGSYCFGLNGLFVQMLKALGFRAYTGAGRINKQTSNGVPIFRSFVHMVIFVQPNEGSNETYLVDVGYGPVRPILLEEGASVMGATPSEIHRLCRTARPDSSLESSPGSERAEKLEWCLECVRDSKDPSRPQTSVVMYSFIEDEFFEVDFQSFNYSLLGLREGRFWENVICTKYFWLNDEEMQEVSADTTKITGRYLGKLTMAGNTVRRHVGTREQVLKVMETELERAEALGKYFAIVIHPEDLEHVRGRGAELKAGPITR
ncbi:hypothetical protein DFH08DRAFT_841149 [Mycena albidolilacea]|uniref:Arylamine N-acetyltransferase n=1 Tax=Mycena albidolilacea TaxID=1033008 RepID=A0AAD7ALW9_9AGAR|nr:hypothetical protein DFH08DRAFT_841149 [Mycena albidolilacea]